MARRAFFSFYYAEDIWRANIVRNSFVTKDWEKNTPVDHASWEAIKRRGDAAVRQWIDRELSGAGVTVVLIGAHTAERPWVLYEIKKSAELGKGLLGIRIHKLEDRSRQTSPDGVNPLRKFTKTVDVVPGLSYWTERKRLSDIFKTYDYVDDDGYHNFKSWVEEAARIADR